MVKKNYSTIEEAIMILGKHGLTIGMIGSYTREKLIRPIIYINSMPAYACELSLDQKNTIAVAHCYISAYLNMGDEATGIIDNLIASDDGTIPINPLIKKEFLIGEPEILDWQYDVSFFEHVPIQNRNPKPRSPDLQIKYFMLRTPKRTATLKLSNILLAHTDIELLRHGLMEHASELPRQPEKTDKQPERKKTNLFTKLITDLHHKCSDKSPKNLWSELERLCEEDFHPILQEVLPWDEHGATIVWKSHRGKERSMGRARFENIISKLNNSPS